MAGAVPQQRGGSNTSTIVMVISIVVAVLLLGALIWLITQQEQLRTTAQQAVAERTRLASGPDATAAKLMFPGGGSLVGEMVKGVQALCRSMTGNEKDTPPTVAAKLGDSLRKLGDDEALPDREQMTASVGAVNIIDNLYKLYRGEREARQAAKTELERAKADLEAALTKAESSQKAFSDELVSVKKKVDDLQLAKNEFEKLKTSETQTLASQISAKQEAMDSLRREHAERTRQLRAELDRSEGLMAEQKEALRALRGPTASGAGELAVARDPVGTVLRALPGDSLIAIDLGKNEGVTLGMPFTLYSANERVPADGRGKAAVEVVSLGLHSAECRVTTPPPPDDPILEGDGAGNIILSRDKGRKPRFCVVGEFDVDLDGAIDPRGSALVSALVERFGGVVVDSVDATTDYLILGVEPAAENPALSEKELAAATPKAPEPEAPTPAQAEEKAAGDDEEASGDEEASADEGAEEPTKEDGESDEATEGDGDSKESDQDEGGEKESDADEEKAETEPEKPAPPAKTEEKPAEAKPAEAKPAPAEPEMPKIARAAEVDLTASPRGRRSLNARQRYDLAVHRAEKFAIPRLPLERFYNFIGVERGATALRYIEGG